MPCSTICPSVTQYLPPLRAPSKEELETSTVSKTQKAAWYVIATLLLVVGFILLVTGVGLLITNQFASGGVIGCFSLALLAFGIYAQINIRRYRQAVKEKHTEDLFQGVREIVAKLPQREEGVTYILSPTYSYISNAKTACNVLRITEDTSFEEIRMAFIQGMQQSQKHHNQAETDRLTQAYAFLVAAGLAPSD